jgi:hypothetical protein
VAQSWNLHDPPDKPNAFSAPLYAIVHRAESAVVALEQAVQRKRRGPHAPRDRPKDADAR